MVRHTLIYISFIFFYSCQQTEKKQIDSVAASVQDCKTLKYGIYHLEGCTMERRDNLQIETADFTGEINRVKVSWLSDCQYQLVDFDGDGDTSTVTITGIGEKFYDCTALYKGQTTKHRIEIIKHGS